MATSANLRLLSLAAAAATCVGQVQEDNLGQLYQLPPQPVGPSFEVGPFGALPHPPVAMAKGPGKQLAEMIYHLPPQYYADPARYMADFARSAAPGASAQQGRVASVGGSAASFAAASNLQQLRDQADGWRHGHEDLEQAISSLRKYLQKSQDEQLQQPEMLQQPRQPQEVMLLQQPRPPPPPQEPNWEPQETLLQRRDIVAPSVPQAVPNYDLTRQAPQPNAALLEFGSQERALEIIRDQAASTVSSFEIMERAFELAVAQHPGFVMVSSVVFGITLALCGILNRARLERGRQQLSEPGQTSGVFFFLVFASGGFGVLWGYGLIQPYWKPLLVGVYVVLTISWFAWLICLQVSKVLMERSAPEASGKLPWCEASFEAGDTPQKRKDP